MKSSARTLEDLPSELFRQIAELLDRKSLGVLRQVSKRTNLEVTDVWLYDRLLPLQIKFRNSPDKSVYLRPFNSGEPQHRVRAKEYKALQSCRRLVLQFPSSLRYYLTIPDSPHNLADRLELPQMRPHSLVYFETPAGIQSEELLPSYCFDYTCPLEQAHPADCLAASAVRGRTYGEAADDYHPRQCPQLEDFRLLSRTGTRRYGDTGEILRHLAQLTRPPPLKRFEANWAYHRFSKDLKAVLRLYGSRLESVTLLIDSKLVKESYPEQLWALCPAVTQVVNYHNNDVVLASRGLYGRELAGESGYHVYQSSDWVRLDGSTAWTRSDVTMRYGADFFDFSIMRGQFGLNDPTTFLLLIKLRSKP
ncbi:F-box protein [Aspergillus homomorphus CBS 101889]|uniref:F-box domain-containing protein n=1 Tax=Aspergillus homomorphus (strain CBS 101889) TaxID=1450537 RepID=A0A395HKN4_ASPHC|nr:hypothetical protein BO97DRAFT_419102 [Aspergillus homomorphus CBS 101889]RAL06824.1 hypothetical protein BO97DRAFT_419102 [Aspergillus homomorphus CBS 101889]